MSREIDALVAEKVMGLWGFCKCDGEIGFTRHPTRDRFECIDCGGWLGENYSTDIAAAWEVVEKLSTWPWCFTRSGETFKFDLGYEGERYYAVAETPAMAICLAALKAKGVDCGV